MLHRKSFWCPTQEDHCGVTKDKMDNLIQWNHFNTISVGSHLCYQGFCVNRICVKGVLLDQLSLYCMMTVCWGSCNPVFNSNIVVNLVHLLTSNLMWCHTILVCYARLKHRLCSRLKKGREHWSEQEVTETLVCIDAWYEVASKTEDDNFKLYPTLRMDVMSLPVSTYAPFCSRA